MGMNVCPRECECERERERDREREREREAQRTTNGIAWPSHQEDSDLDLDFQDNYFEIIQTSVFLL